MKRIVFYGDSLTYGFDPRGAFGGRFPESIRWTEVLKARLLAEWEIDVRAENGREIPETPSEIANAVALLASAKPYDVLAVMLGTNDYLNMYQPNVVEVTGRMKHFLEAVAARDEGAQYPVHYLLIVPPMIYTAQDEFYAKYDTTSGIFSKAYKALAEHLDIHIADSTLWNLPPAFDGIHMTEDGNRIFADRMEETLTNLSLIIDMERAV